MIKCIVKYQIISNLVSHQMKDEFKRQSLKLRAENKEK
jgi:hypothetical protein